MKGLMVLAMTMFISPSVFAFGFFADIFEYQECEKAFSERVTEAIDAAVARGYSCDEGTIDDNVATHTCVTAVPDLGEDASDYTCDEGVQDGDSMIFTCTSGREGEVMTVIGKVITSMFEFTNTCELPERTPVTVYTYNDEIGSWMMHVE
ncbi:MAG: hypothetical protein OXB84_02170 [Halobacteriovoraceae bacterium]|nr:hypothetical protein [Halobacteriovoraceae bacterium]